MKLDFDVSEYVDKVRKDPNFFHTFINRNSLAAGVLVLKPGEEDTQTPHDSDEVYFVIKGDGFLRIQNKDYPIKEHKMYFVKKNIEHYFHDNKKELVVLYFFGGPDS